MRLRQPSAGRLTGAPPDSIRERVGGGDPHAAEPRNAAPAQRVRPRQAHGRDKARLAGTGAVLREIVRGTVRHRGFKLLVTAGLVAGLAAVAWAGDHFVRTAEARLARLPARVGTEAADRGDRFLPLSSIPLAQRHAVVAVENRSFYTDIGISFEGLARAAWIDLVERRFAQGGSTVTEDLVRDQLLQPHERTIPWKLTEIAYAVLAAQRFSKAQIMDMFLNQAYFGHQAYGVAAAAHTYFGVGLRGLNLRQETLLAGLLQAPTALDPLVHPRAALARQAVVLTAMVSAGYLTPAQARAVGREPLRLRHGP